MWRLFDPALRRIGWRLDLLEERRARARRKRRLAKAALFDGTVVFHESAIVRNWAKRREHIRVGAYSHVAGELSVVSPDGSIDIGEYTFVGEGTRIWAQNRVEIGRHVLIAHQVDIHDTNSHSIYYQDRREDTINLFQYGNPVDWNKVVARPVKIEDDVWIGFKASVLKGVTIGRGAVVAAASVVTRDVSSFTLVAGNPARVVREIARDRETR